jgi:hypothetical protein
MLSKHFWFLLPLAFLWACAPDAETAQQEQNNLPSLRFEERVIARQEGACNGKSSHGCITLHIAYPDPVEGPAALRHNFQGFLQDYLVSTLNGINTSPNDETQVSEAIERLFADYQRHREQFPKASFPWEVEIEGRIIYQSDRYLTLQMNHYEYTGGAHPNGWVNYAVFDPQTGQQPRLDQIVSNQKEIEQLGEVIFRAEQGIGPKEDLNQIGFHFEGGEFYLPDNFGVTAEGLIFHFNPYEIAPHVVGPISFVVPLESVQPTVSRP